MNEPIVKIISGDYVNITYENDVYYNLNLSENNYYLITTLESDFSGQEYTTKEKNLGDIELYARYVGKSRIDRLPLFAIDLASSIRKNKIDQIIN
jgi:hypothetical protein